MGQRLNLEICIDNEPLANVYYHWSGYTQAALQLADDFINGVTRLQAGSKNDKLVPIVLTALRNSGAGLSEKEAAALIERFPDLIGQPVSRPALEKDLNRNNGLIAFSEDGMNETRCCAEATVTIDVGTKLVSFDAVWSGDDMDPEYTNGQLTAENTLDIGDIRIDSALSYETFHRLAIMGLRRPVPFCWREDDGTIWACIE